MRDDLRRRIEQFIIDCENADLENMATTDMYLQTAVDLLTEVANEKV